jgi:hypothetical protein
MEHPDDRVRADERKRIASALRRYFDEGPGTYRTLITYLELDYGDGIHEGWLDLNNAIAEHDAKVASGERVP